MTRGGSTIRRTALAAALAITLMMTGCVQTLEELQGTDETNGANATDEMDHDQDSPTADGRTAMQARSLADELAEGWHEDAQLMVAATVETPRVEFLAMVLSNETLDAGIFEPDEHVGDGLAPQWMFLYHTPDGEDGLRVVVPPDGSPVAMNETPEADDDKRPIRDWSVDSDRALEIAKTDDRFRRTVSMSNVSVRASLVYHDAPGHLWQLYARSADADGPRPHDSGDSLDGHASAYVNATTDELENPFEPPENQQREPYAFTGELSTANPNTTYELEVPADDGYVSFDLRWGEPGEGEAYEMNVTLARDGEAIPVEDFRRVDETWIEGEAEHLEPGPLELQVHLTNGPSQEDRTVPFEVEGHVVAQAGSG